MTITRLEDILDLVGNLDDTPGDSTARARFRKYLARSASSIGVVRDYVETCLRTSGSQYNRSLQDLVNHTGRLIGFEVEFGRYQGTAAEIGFDGIWRANGLSLVVEVKTSDAYTIDTATLLGYIDRLIGAKRIEDWDHALGLYVLGRTDSGLTQLEHSILGQKRSHQLRVATIESILSLAELRQEGLISLAEAIALLKPTTVRVDDIVDILTRVAAQGTAVSAPSEVPPALSQVSINEPPAPYQAALRPERLYLLTPVSDDGEETAQDVIRGLLDSGWYVFGNRTPGRKELKPGDRLCFYASAIGIVAEAEVVSKPEQKVVSKARHPEKFPWAFKIMKPRYFFDQPVVIDADLRSRLDAFTGREPSQPWAWFVQATRKVTEHDFHLLVGQG